MKKIVTILLTLVMVLTLAACADNSEPAANDKNIDASQNAEDKPSVPSEAENESRQPGETPSEPADGTSSEPDQEPAGKKILVAYFSKHLYKVQVFIINSLTTYIVLPNILSKVIPNGYSILISLVLAIIVGIYSIKYKYIVTIITTSITESMLVFNQILALLNFNKNSNSRK